MPRPKLRSDDEILDAAVAVLRDRGPLAFTLSDVAAAVGLSRAALIQRFTNRDTLLVRMMRRSIAQARVHLDAIPIGPGPQGLWTFLQSLLRSMNTRYDFSVNFLITWYELQVPELRALARQRTRAVIAELDRRLPGDAPAGAAPLLHAVIAGAATQWTTEPRGTPSPTTSWRNSPPRCA
jgi:AcrR family transcriptional regulator